MVARALLGLVKTRRTGQELKCCLGSKSGSRFFYRISVSEKAFHASFPETQIQFVLQAISFRGCESLVFVTYLDLSLSALYSTLFHSTPLNSTPLICRYAVQGNARKQIRLSVRNRKKLIFVVCLMQREGGASKNVFTGNVSDASTQRRG